MKRSEINATIKQFEALLDQYRFRIPPYLSFTPEEWADKNHEWDEIRDNMLGWDTPTTAKATSNTRGWRSSPCATAT